VISERLGLQEQAIYHVLYLPAYIKEARIYSHCAFRRTGMCVSTKGAPRKSLTKRAVQYCKRIVRSWFSQVSRYWTVLTTASVGRISAHHVEDRFSLSRTTGPDRHMSSQMSSRLSVNPFARVAQEHKLLASFHTLQTL